MSFFKNYYTVEDTILLPLSFLPKGNYCLEVNICIPYTFSLAKNSCPQFAEIFLCVYQRYASEQMLLKTLSFQSKDDKSTISWETTCFLDIIFKREVWKYLHHVTIDPPYLEELHSINF